MTDLEKHIYRPAFFERLCPVLRQYIPGFDSRDFIFRIFDNGWPDLSYFEKTQKISHVLHRFMPGNFPAAVSLLVSISSAMGEFENADLECGFMIDYIDVFGSEFPLESSLASAEISRAIHQNLPEQSEIIQQ